MNVIIMFRNFPELCCGNLKLHIGCFFNVSSEAIFVFFLCSDRRASPFETKYHLQPAPVNGWQYTALATFESTHNSHKYKLRKLHVISCVLCGLSSPYILSNTHFYNAVQLRVVSTVSILAHWSSQLYVLSSHVKVFKHKSGVGLEVGQGEKRKDPDEH